MKKNLIISYTDLQFDDSFDVINIQDYNYGHVNEFDFLNWAGYEKCKIECENRRLYEKVIFTNKHFEGIDDVECYDYYLYTNMYELAYSKDEYYHTSEKKLIVPNFNFWLCNSITFDVISSLDNNLIESADDMKKVISYKNTDVKSKKFFHILSFFSINTKVING